jgi:hypothetical protein
LFSLMRKIEAGEPTRHSELDLASDDAHQLAEDERKRLLNDLFKVRGTLPRLQCMAPVTPPCRNRPIRSHTMQRSGPLELLADGTGHVLSLENDPRSKSRGAAMVRVGLDEASTFQGLCSHHDNALWRLIDVESLVRPSAEQLFLLSYRTILMHLFGTRRERARLTKLLRITVKAGNRGNAGLMLAYLTRNNWGGSRLGKITEWYRKLFENKSHETGLIHLIGRNIGLLPFAVSCYVEPVFYPDGSRVPPASGSQVGPFFTLNVVPQVDGSIVVLTYPAKFRDRLRAFFQPLQPPISEAEFVERVWEITLRYCENIVVRERLWEIVPRQVQQAILDFYNSDPHKWRPSPGRKISLVDWARKMTADEIKSHIAAWDKNSTQ